MSASININYNTLKLKRVSTDNSNADLNAVIGSGPKTINSDNSSSNNLPDELTNE